MIRGELLGFGSGNSARPVPSGCMRPMRFPALSVNQTVPSCVRAIVVGPLPGLGSGNSVDGAVGARRFRSAGPQPALLTLTHGHADGNEYP